MVLMGSKGYCQAEEERRVGLPIVQRASSAKQYLARILGANRQKVGSMPAKIVEDPETAADTAPTTAATKHACPVTLHKHCSSLSGSSSSSSTDTDSLIKVAEDFSYTPQSCADMQCDDTRDQDFADSLSAECSHQEGSLSSASPISEHHTPLSVSGSSDSSFDEVEHAVSSSDSTGSCLQSKPALASEFLQMQSLKYLTIQNLNFVNFNQQDMECLASCTGLTRLHWTDNSNLPEGGILTALATLTNLSHLHISTVNDRSNEVLPHCSGSLSRLTNLTLLSSTAHSEPATSLSQWSELSHLRSLKHLTLRPAPDVRQLKQWLPKLETCKVEVPESMAVAEYLQELLTKERSSWVHMGSMVGLQREVTLGMRAVLVDWMIEIADEWHLFWESLHLGIHLLDVFLAARRVPRRSLQLLAVTCLWVGAKYHELHPPSVRECARLVDSRCHWRDVIRMEEAVLDVVGFDMSAPTVSVFLKAYMSGIAQDEIVPSFAQYFCDLAVIHYSTTRFPPSYIASAALWLAVGLGRMHAPEACVVPGLKLGQKELAAAVQELVSAYKWASYGNGRSAYVKQKYSSRRFHRIAKLPLSNSGMPMQ